MIFRTNICPITNFTLGTFSLLCVNSSTNGSSTFKVWFFDRKWCLSVGSLASIIVLAQLLINKVYLTSQLRFLSSKVIWSFDILWIFLRNVSKGEKILFENSGHLRNDEIGLFTKIYSQLKTESFFLKSIY